MSKVYNLVMSLPTLKLLQQFGPVETVHGPQIHDKDRCHKKKREHTGLSIIVLSVRIVYYIILKCHLTVCHIKHLVWQV